MVGPIDRLAMALASGSSRRAAVAAILSGAVATLPWTAEARKKRKKRKKKFKKFQAACNQWCADRFELDPKARNTCIEKAKEGKGACYSAVDEGPAFFCRNVLKCGTLNCCPTLIDGGPVKDGQCCETPCGQIVNGTVICT